MSVFKINQSNFDKLPIDQQEMIYRKVADVILETFINPADIDYINARFLALNHQHRPFFWSALQAIEKYLKANLLLHGISVKGKSFGHHIVNMAEKLATHSDALTSLRLSPAKEHHELERFNLWGNDCPIEFIASIEKYGHPSNRYNFFGSDYAASYLPKLDQTVRALRSEFVEKTLYGTGKSHMFDYAAYEQNFCFAPTNYEHDPFYAKFSLGITVPSIEAVLKGVFGHTAIFESWLLTNIEINSMEINKIRSL